MMADTSNDLEAGTIEDVVMVLLARPMWYGHIGGACSPRLAAELVAAVRARIADEIQAVAAGGTTRTIEKTYLAAASIARGGS